MLPTLERVNSADTPGTSPRAITRVTVVGGSAAGFFTAYLLARRGIPVEIVEQSGNLQPDARTLIVTDRMRALLGPAGESCVVNQIRRFELFTDGRVATIELNRPDLVIERAALIRRLAQEAETAGARLTLGLKFRRLHPHGPQLALELERCSDGRLEEWHSAVVVGGDGASSNVAKAAGWPKQPTVPLIQAIVPLPRGMDANAVRVWFVPDDTPYFYWLIPESSSRGALGLIGESGDTAHRCLERFLKKRQLEPIEFQGARIPVYTGWVPVARRVGAARVYLVGDAAGQVKVTTVGGIVTGLRGAVGVAEAILNGDPSPELRSLRRELNLHLVLRRSLHHFTQADYCRLVDLLDARARRSLSQYSRDDALKILWRICLSQPRMLLMGLRGLLAGRNPLRRAVP